MSFTTRQAAERAGISLRTLQRWIASGKIKAPTLAIVRGKAARFWSKSDIARIKKAKRK